MNKYGLLIASIVLCCAGCASSTEKSVSVEFVQEQVQESETGNKLETTIESTVSDEESVATVESKDQAFWSVSESSTVSPESEERVSESELETVEDTKTVDPIYFEGSLTEVRRQKLALLKDNGYYSGSMNYVEKQGNTGVDLDYEFFRETDERYYSEDEFSDCPDLVLKLAKNEIYARHGRMFYDRELYEYFLTRMWYYPEYTPEEFDENCLNEYEKANIELLVSLGA